METTHQLRMAAIDKAHASLQSEHDFNKMLEPLIYFFLKNGVATAQEQQQAADIVESRSRAVLMLVAVDSWKESVVYDKQSEKWILRGNRYDTFYNAIAEEWRIDYRKYLDSQVSLLDQIIEASEVNG